jgi:hypothetical protein
MPFKSKAQQRFMFAAESRGEVPKGTARRWAHHTKSIKSLPERKHKKEGMAWLGRNVSMPAVRGAAKPLEWLLRKIYEPAGKAVGKYREGLGAVSGITESARNVPHRTVEAIGAAKGVIPEGIYGKEYEDAMRDLVENSLSKQRLYGGVGAAAVGVPALAGVLGGISAKRRRKAEAELEAALAEKEASVSFAKQLGMRVGMSKQALLPQLGETVSPAIARILELVGAKAQGAELRGLAGRSQFLRGAVRGMEPEQAKGVLKGTHIYDPYSSMVEHSSGPGWTATKNVGQETLNRDLSARKTMRNIGAGTAATGAGVAGGTTAAIVGGAHSKKKKEGKKPEKAEKKEKKEAQLGTPFMDGFLSQCSNAGLDEVQAVNVIEKAAQLQGQLGDECRAFLERIAAAE